MAKSVFDPTKRYSLCHVGHCFDQVMTPPHVTGTLPAGYNRTLRPANKGKGICRFCGG